MISVLPSIFFNSRTFICSFFPQAGGKGGLGGFYSNRSIYFFKKAQGFLYVGINKPPKTPLPPFFLEEGGHNAPFFDLMALFALLTLNDAPFVNNSSLVFPNPYTQAAGAERFPVPANSVHRFIQFRVQKAALIFRVKIRFPL